MAKDKPKNRLSVNDLVAQQASASVNDAKSKSYEDGFNEDTFEYNDEVIEDLKNYNKNIEDIDDIYKGVKPRFKVLLRCFVSEVRKDDNGLIIPNTIPIPIPTKSGMGDMALVETPWPYSKKAVVIAAPEGSNLEKGDIVMLAKQPITGVVGRGNNAMLSISDGFIHPDEQGKYPAGFPTDPNDKNYGFLLKADYDIEIELKND